MLAHRGASARELENTLPAFTRAMSEGADGVELDVQRCASGEVVVFHDADVERLAGRRGRIAELTWRQLQKVRLRGGASVPTLEEVLAVLPAPALVNIEIKHDAWWALGCRALVEAVAEVVERAKAHSRVLISSFNPAAIWYWQSLQPAVPSGLLFERRRRFRKPWPLHAAWLVPLLRPLAVHPEDALCTPDSVSFWRRHGFGVHVWTVDDPRRTIALAAMGATAIITNDPAVARSALTLTLGSTGG